MHWVKVPARTAFFIQTEQRNNSFKEVNLLDHDETRRTIATGLAGPIVTTGLFRTIAGPDAVEKGQRRPFCQSWAAYWPLRRSAVCAYHTLGCGVQLYTALLVICTAFVGRYTRYYLNLVCE